MTTEQRTILCVDDEPHVLNALKRLFRKENYAVLTADNVSQALDLLREHHVQLVISDQRMPEMSGVEFLQKVKDISSDTVRVILSGYADVNIIVDSINQGEVFRFLTKPWNDDELRAAIRQCLTHHDIMCQNRRLHDQIRVQNQKLRQLNTKMEKMVHLRTRGLEVSQEVLEHLPLPVLCISREGMVLVVNRAAENLISRLRGIAPDADMHDVLPESAARAVMACLKGASTTSTVDVLWDSKPLALEIKSLGDDQDPRGCMLILHPKTDDANPTPPPTNPQT